MIGLVSAQEINGNESRRKVRASLKLLRAGIGRHLKHVRAVRLRLTKIATISVYQVIRFYGSGATKSGSRIRLDASNLARDVATDICNYQ